MPSIYAAPCAVAISSKCRRLRILLLLGHTEHSASKSRIVCEWFGAASGNKRKQISDRRGRALCDSLPFPYHDMDDGRGDSISLRRVFNDGAQVRLEWRMAPHWRANQPWSKFIPCPLRKTAPKFIRTYLRSVNQSPCFISTNKRILMTLQMTTACIISSKQPHYGNLFSNIVSSMHAWSEWSNLDQTCLVLLGRVLLHLRNWINELLIIILEKSWPFDLNGGK